MRRLIITEEFGIWTVETSAGVRATGHTLDTALQKLLPLDRQGAFASLDEVFQGIRPTTTGQIREGLQS